MQQKFKDWLIQYAESKDYDTDDNSLMEIITEADEVERETYSSSRWYDTQTVVVKIEDKFVSYIDYHITGDNSMFDMGLEYNLADCEEVEPYETIVTKYRYKNQ